MLQPSSLFWMRGAPINPVGQEGPADDFWWSVRLCLVVPLFPLGQPLLGTGKCSVPGCCPFTAQLLSPGVFLATSNKASQPNVCPLIFATVIHPLAVLAPGCFLWEGPCTLCPCRGSQVGNRMAAPVCHLLCPLLLLQQVHLIVGQALKRYSEDRVGMVDYALESAGRCLG